MTEPSLEFIAKRLADMQALLLALNDNAAAVNRRLERIEFRIEELTGEVRRVDHRLQALELRTAELAVRLGGVEASH